MGFRVKQTEQADYDLDVILERLLAQEAGDAGLRWFRKLKESIDSLAEMPERCMLAPENAEFPFEVRQLLYGHKPHRYRVLFTIEAETVVVLHIRHGRRRRLGEPH
jgi:plasmid stabilization system protein ParE